ncbi:MAG: hypothetical protein JWL61_4994 [Gemmatimonadetes bacterium]|nr:hypothetical protein [Gemmatimonadota bacterium]
MAKKALVRNAADAAQVKAAKESEQFLSDERLNDWRAVLSSPEGRRVLWRVLGQCNTNKSVFAVDHGTISYRAGWQDAGHYVLAEINEADPRAFLRMIEEANRIEVNKVEPPETIDDA